MRLHSSVRSLLVAALLVTSSCGDDAPSGPVAGTIGTAKFTTASSFARWDSAKAYLHAYLYTYANPCGATNFPPDVASAMLVQFDVIATAAKPGTFDVPGATRDIAARSFVYSTNTESALAGTVHFETVSASRATGWLRLGNPDQKIQVAGQFDIPLCP
jgi:hypothetical protein